MSNKIIKHASALAVLATISAPALAEDSLNYNYLSASYLDTRLDDPDLDGDGIDLRGSVEVSDSLFFTAGYASQSFDFDIDLNQWSVGIGGHLPLSDRLDLVGTVSYVDAEIETDFGSDDENGFGTSVGLRAALASNFELEGGISYLDLGDAGDDTTLNLGARYYFSPEFALGAGVSAGDDVTTWNLGVRFEF